MKKKLNIYVITITLSKVANPFLRDNRKKSNVVKAIWNKSSAQCLKRKPGDCTHYGSAWGADEKLIFKEIKGYQ